MGGKTKQSQRTKNNARPSSSGRSALLLPGAGAAESTLFPTLCAPTLDPDLDPDLQMSLKKLYKKDPITKTKGLQELCERLRGEGGEGEGEAGAEAAEQAARLLPTWARLYPALAADCERRVRELAQACHGALLAASGRRAAPHLRALLPPWLAAHHDEHAPAAARAQASLDKTFPAGKLPEVIAFCKDDIMAHVRDALAGAAPPAARVETAEERSEREARAVCGSLHALQTCVRLLPAAHDNWLSEQLDALFAAPAFWKKASHPDPKVRAAWYGLVGAAAARGGAGGAAGGARALRALLAARETGPLPAAGQWGALLAYMQHVLDWHLQLDSEELLSKRILDVLRSGGWGEARALCAVLPGLLARLPPALRADRFYQDFFDAFLQGLEQKSILNSAQERRAWLASLQHCLGRLAGERGAFSAVCGAHRAWLRCALAPRAGRPALLRHCAAAMAALAHDWLQRAVAAEGDTYERLLRAFWHNIGAEAVAQADLECADTLGAHLLLLRTLRTSYPRDGDTRRGVKFEDDAVEESAPAPACATPSAAEERYLHGVAEVARRVAAHYVQLAVRARNLPAPLLALLAEFGDAALFEEAARELQCSGPRALYETQLRPWLAGAGAELDAVADLVFFVMEHIPETDRDTVYDSFDELGAAAVERCVRRALAGGAGGGARWVRGRRAGAALSAAAARLLAAPDPPAQELLLAALRRDPQGELLISEDTVSSIAGQVTAALERIATTAGAESQMSDGADPEEKVEPSTNTQPEDQCGAVEAEPEEEPRPEAGVAAEERAARLAVALVHVLDPAQPALAPLVLALFRLTLAVPAGARLPAQAWQAAAEAWRAGVRAAPRPARRAVMHGAAAALRDYMRLHDDTLDLRRMEVALALCPGLLAGDDDVEQLYTDIIEASTAADTLDSAPSSDSAPTPLHFALRQLIVRGDINCPYEDEYVTEFVTHDCDRAEIQEMSRESLLPFLKKLSVRVMYWRGAAEPAARARRHLLRSLHDFCVLRVLYDTYAFWPHYDIIKEVKEKLEMLIREVIEQSSEDARSEVSRALEAAAAATGYFWAFARRWFQRACTTPLQKHAEHNIGNEQETTRELEENKDIVEQQTEENEQESGTNTNTDISCENVDKLDNVTRECVNSLTREQQESTDISINKIENKENVVQSKEIVEKDHSIELSQENVTSTDTVSENCENDDEEVMLDLEKMAQIFTGCGFFHSLQASEYGRNNSLRSSYLVMVRSLHVAYGDDIGALGPSFHADVIAGQTTCDADVIVNAYYHNNDIMLYERDVSVCAWGAAAGAAAAARYLAALVRARGWSLPPHHWDFATITLCNLVTSVLHSRRRWGCAKVALVARAALQLYAAVEQFVRALPAECTRRTPAAHVAHLAHEWRDIFAPDLNANLLDFVAFVLEERSHTAVSSNHIAVFDVLILCTRRLDWSLVPSARRVPAGGAREAEGEAAAWAGLAAAALADTSHYCYKYLAYELLLTLLKPMVLEDAAALEAWIAPGEAGAAARGAAAEAGGEAPRWVEGGEAGPEGPRPRCSLLQYRAASRALEDLLGAALAHVKVCEETCALQAGSDVHRLALGWLLLADAAGRHACLARSDLHHHYVHIYREARYLEPLLVLSLRLLPVEALQLARRAPPAPAPSPALRRMFAAMPDLGVYKQCGAAAVSAAACRALYWSVRGPGAAEARGWRGAAHHAHARTLDHLLETFISPLIVKEEFTLLQQKAGEIEDMEVSIQWSSYEAVATLTLEDRAVVLRTQLARTHPLGLPRLAAERAPAPHTGWLVMYVGYQRGSLLGAVRLWAAAVRGRVRRAPVCCVCYCRLHYASGRLPASHCRTCRNAFHAACLNKWFSSSNKSNCPVCRSAF